MLDRVQVSLVKLEEIEEVYKLIARTTKKSFKYYYPEKVIDEIIETMNCEVLTRRAGWTHFYVFKLEGKIIACGAIGPYWGSETESSLFTIFVDPDYQGCGVGRKVIETLESDEYFLRADRVEIPAAICALPFYGKMGYTHKNGEMIFVDNNVKLEKYNKR